MYVPNVQLRKFFIFGGQEQKKNDFERQRYFSWKNHGKRDRNQNIPKRVRPRPTLLVVEAEHQVLVKQDQTDQTEHCELIPRDCGVSSLGIQPANFHSCRCVFWYICHEVM